MEHLKCDHMIHSWAIFYRPVANLTILNTSSERKNVHLLFENYYLFTLTSKFDQNKLIKQKLPNHNNTQSV